ncbi:U8 snoRNA-decapping enzyme [Blattella germanica]|nr:U8 snoRNA-decapping enzyme [Blattella germanica]
MSSTTGDKSWGHLADTERYGRKSDDYVTIPRSDLFKAQYKGLMHAAHCMIYSRTSDRIFGIYSARAIILMQMRFDGYIGFPGGLIDEGEDIVFGLNRELVEEMHIDINKYPVKEENHVVTHWCPSQNLVLHFYALELPISDLKSIEESAMKAHDYGTETLGTIRLPLYTMGDGYRGFPAFLANNFVGNSKEQLLHGLVHLNIMSAEEIIKAKEAVPS